MHNRERERDVYVCVHIYTHIMYSLEIPSRDVSALISEVRATYLDSNDHLTSGFNALIISRTVFLPLREQERRMKGASED